MPTLERALGSENKLARAAALETISQIPSRQSVDLLAAALKAEDLELREQSVHCLLRMLDGSSGDLAARALGKARRAEAAAPLAEKLGQADPSISLLTICSVLSEIGTPALPALMDAAHRRQCKNPRAVIDALVAIGGPAVNGFLIEELPRSSGAWKRSIIQALGAMKLKGAVESLIRCVGPDTIDDAVEALGNIGDLRAAGCLAGLLEKGDLDLRKKIARALARMKWKPAAPEERIRFFIAAQDWAQLGAAGKGALPALLREVAKPEFASGAVKALGQLREPSTVEVLLKLSEHWDDEVRGAAVGALGHFNEPRVADRILTMAGEKLQFWTQQAVGSCLGVLKDPRGAEILTAWLQDRPSDPVFEEALLEIGPPAAAPLLRRCSESAPPRSALSALTKILQKHPEVISELAEGADDRGRRGLWLAMPKQTEQGMAVISAWLHDERREVRSEALEWLKGTPGLARPLLAHVEPLLADASPTVRCGAIAVIGNLQGPEALSLLLPHIQTECVSVSKAVSRSLSSGSEEQLAKAFFEGTSELAAEAAGRLAQKPSAQAVFSQALQLREGERWVCELEKRRLAAEALGTMGDQRAQSVLVEAIWQDPDSQTRRIAAEALTRLGWSPATPEERASVSAAKGLVSVAAAEGGAAVWPLLLSGGRGRNKEAVSAITSLGGVAVEPLLALAGERPAYLCDIAFLLGEIKDPRAIPVLSKTLEESLSDNSRDVREALGECLFTLGWYPEAGRRQKFAEVHWPTALRLGFAEAIAPALQHVYQVSREPSHLDQTRQHLARTSCRSPLTPEMASMAIYASTFQHKFHGGKYDAGYLSIDQSTAAIRQIAAVDSRLTSNLLHFIKNKVAASVRMQTGCGGDWTETLNFQDQRMFAVNELERRGNPEYDPGIFVLQE